MKFKGFIGAAYQLDSSNVDAQACVNLYPEMIESGSGKAEQVAYLRGTPGLTSLLEVGDGPIRCVHLDSIGRIFVVSGNQLFQVINRDDWRMTITPVTFPTYDDIDQSSKVSTLLDYIQKADHEYETGLKVRVSSTNTLPTGLSGETDYWVINFGVNHIRLATSLANAIAGTQIDISGTGTGTLTITPQTSTTLQVIGAGSFSASDDSVTKIAHGCFTGLKVRLEMVGEMPAGLATLTDYYLIVTNVNTIQFASSAANASAGTAIDITAISSDEWLTQLVGANGEDGGSPVTLSSLEGTVRAASMSFGGDGTDSSTVFVDGVNNYLFKDENGVTTFTNMGSVPVAQVVFDVTDDITISSTTDVDDLLAEGSFSITQNSSGSGAAAGQIEIGFYSSIVTPFTYRIIITFGSGSSLTTEELVQYINEGFVSGKTILFNTKDVSNLERIPFSKFTASGGGAQSVAAAFTSLSTYTETFSESTRAGLEFGTAPNATDVVWSDGYFILTEGGTNRFRVSDLQSFDLDALSFASSEGNPDIALALGILNRYLYIFNEKTTEVYANTGNADFPFERIQGGFIETGCAAAGSVAKVGPVLCWLGRSEDGEGIVYAIEGLQPQRISTHAIEQAIRGYADTSTATAYSYQSGGHTFYVLNFDEATWVYDLSTRMWHQRAYTNAGELERHRGQYCAYVPAHKLHLVGDYESNKIYTMSESVFSDDGDAITRLRAFPYISNGRNRVFCSSLQLDMETGIGLDGGGQGSNPTVMLDWSNDNGNTWSSESWALADAGSGQIGDFMKRVIWNRLGSFRSRVFRVKITDPVKVRLIDAQIEIEGGSN